MAKAILYKGISLIVFKVIEQIAYDKQLYPVRGKNAPIPTERHVLASWSLLLDLGAASATGAQQHINKYRKTNQQQQPAKQKSNSESTPTQTVTRTTKTNDRANGSRGGPKTGGEFSSKSGIGDEETGAKTIRQDFIGAQHSSLYNTTTVTILIADQVSREFLCCKCGAEKWKYQYTIMGIVSRRLLCASYFRGQIFKTTEIKILYSSLASVSTSARMSHVRNAVHPLPLGSQFRGSRIIEKVPVIVADAITEQRTRLKYSTPKTPGKPLQVHDGYVIDIIVADDNKSKKTEEKSGVLDSDKMGNSTFSPYDRIRQTTVMMYKDEEEKHLLDDDMDKPVIVELLRTIPPKLGSTYYVLNSIRQKKEVVMDMSVREPMQMDSFESTDLKAFLEEDAGKWNNSREMYSHLDPEHEDSNPAKMIQFISFKSESIGARYEYKSYGLDFKSRQLVREKLSPAYALLQASNPESNSVSGLFVKMMSDSL
ncbi:hypothetical protein ABG067_005503 [Albugo candida]